MSSDRENSLSGRQVTSYHGTNFALNNTEHEQKVNADRALNGSNPQHHFRRGYNDRPLLRDEHGEKKRAPICQEMNRNMQSHNKEPMFRNRNDSFKRKYPEYHSSSHHDGPNRTNGPPPSSRYDDNTGYRSRRPYNNNRPDFSNNNGLNVVYVVDQLISNPITRARPILDDAYRAARSPFDSGKAVTSILALLGRRRRLSTALAVWDWMDNAGIQKNAFHYNALIASCEKMRNSERALSLLKEMDDRGVMKNDVTYSSAISACEKSGRWRTALDLLDEMYDRKVPRTVIVYNAAISACEKGIAPSRAMKLFEQMKSEGVKPTVITYSALISAAEKGQQWKLALQVLREMKQEFPHPNVIAYSATISALSKGQQWKLALELFRELESSSSSPPSVVTYNATINALEKGMQWSMALDLFEEMKSKGLPVTVVSYGSSISACEKGQQWKQCLHLLDEMTEYNVSKNVIVFGAAMSCMEKSGRAEISFQLMDRMREEGIAPNVHIYNSAISACARTGGLLWSKAVQLFNEMPAKKITPDIVTYNALLDATADHHTDVALPLFKQGLKLGLYSRVARMGENQKWVELDLHFLSLGGGEVACRWFFEDRLCEDMNVMQNIQSIDIMVGSGRTRYRGVRAENDGMLKRVLFMLECFDIKVLNHNAENNSKYKNEREHRSRVKVDVEYYKKRVLNGDRFKLDCDRYSELKKSLNEAMIAASNVPQIERKKVPPIGLIRSNGNANQKGNNGSQQRYHNASRHEPSEAGSEIRRRPSIPRQNDVHGPISESSFSSPYKNYNHRYNYDSKHGDQPKFNDRNRGKGSYVEDRILSPAPSSGPRVHSPLSKPMNDRFVPRQQVKSERDSRLNDDDYKNREQSYGGRKWIPPSK